jgi:hypothetical protein
MKIESSAFSPGQPIPQKYAQDGQNVSPPLRWSGVPASARELVLLVEDPDAPKPFPNPFIHWVLYKIPPSTTALHEGVLTEKTLAMPNGAMQGQNSAGKIGYVGPAPPPGHGPHHYHFKLLALDTELSVAPALDRDALKVLMAEHIVDQTELVGTYEKWAAVGAIKAALTGE